MLQSRRSNRLIFQYNNYTTTFLRALAWFGDQTWSRNGIELDNFLSCGPYKPMDASHLCHHDHGTRTQSSRYIPWKLRRGSFWGSVRVAIQMVCVQVGVGMYSQHYYTL